MHACSHTTCRWQECIESLEQNNTDSFEDYDTYALASDRERVVCEERYMFETFNRIIGHGVGASRLRYLLDIASSPPS